MKNLVFVVFLVFLVSACGKKEVQVTSAPVPPVLSPVTPPPVPTCHMEVLSTATYEVGPYDVAKCQKAEEVMKSSRLIFWENGTVAGIEVDCDLVNWICK